MCNKEYIDAIFEKINQTIFNLINSIPEKEVVENIMLSVEQNIVEMIKKDTDEINYTNLKIILMMLNSLLVRTLHDSKFNQMITKTNNTNVLKKTEAVINSIENQKIKTTDSYKKISDCLFDILFITSNPPNDKEDYLRALQFQQILIDLMIQFVNSKVNSVQE